MGVDTNACKEPAHSTGDAYLNIVFQIGVFTAYGATYGKLICTQKYHTWHKHHEHKQNGIIQPIVYATDAW